MKRNQLYPRDISDLIHNCLKLNTIILKMNEAGDTQVADIPSFQWSFHENLQAGASLRMTLGVELSKFKIIRLIYGFLQFIG